MTSSWTAFEVWDHVSGTGYSHPYDPAFAANLLNLLGWDPDTPPMRVLDLGGGAGNPGIRLAELGHEVTIVDCDTQMLEAARRRAATHGVNLRLIHADWRQLRRQEAALHNHWDAVLFLGNSLGYQDSWPQLTTPTSCSVERLVDTLAWCKGLLAGDGRIVVETALEAERDVEHAYVRHVRNQPADDGSARESFWLIRCDPASGERTVETHVLGEPRSGGRQEIMASFTFRGYLLSLGLFDRIIERVSLRRLEGPRSLRGFLEAVILIPTNAS